MVDRAKKISEHDAITSVVGSDLLIVVSDPGGNNVATKTITVLNLLANSANVRATSIKNTSVPATANATGVAGEVRYNTDHFYVCVATNTWKRTALSTW